MHNNFYFLRQLGKCLAEILKDSVISECFSQNKDELVIRFERQTESFFIKADLQPVFSCLSFPEEFNRARRNSIDLFTSLIGCQVLGVRQYENERSFSLQLSGQYSLLFKMHGNKSNIIAFREADIIEVFRKNLRSDYTLSLDTLDRQIDWSYKNFSKNLDHLPVLYFTFGKPVWEYLHQNGFDALDVHTKWKAIQELRQLLAAPTYFITEQRTKIALQLMRTSKLVRELHDPVEALNTFYTIHQQRSAFLVEKNVALTALNARLKSAITYLQTVSKKLKDLEHDNHYKIWADLLMANLTGVTAGQENVILENFYDNNKPIHISLKKHLSPQKNAELFYRKAKNQSIEKEFLQQALESKAASIEQLNSVLKSLESSSDLRHVRSVIKEYELTKSKQEDVVSLPYYEAEHKGYKIWVGKNAAGNDELTLRHSYKEDLWLHAKDVAGSHVLIKHQAGKKIPKDVIERAAQIAAYNSKRKTESLCAVIVTPKKFVRKRKGDPPGAVVVEKEEVILVEPASA